MILGILRTTAALGLLLAVLAIPGRAQDDAIPVDVDPARLDEVSETVAVIGRFVSRQSGIVASQSDGPVANVLVEVGDRVVLGAPLVEIDTRRIALDRDLWQAELAAARAALVAAQAMFSMEMQALGRVNDLSESAAFSQARQDDQVQQVAAAEAGVAGARAQVLRAESNLALAQDVLDDATIRAPYDGVVALRHTEVGSFLDIGDPVVTLVNDTFIEIEADVPYGRLAALDTGAVVTLLLEDGSAAEAFVRAVGVSQDAQARTRPVRFTPAWSVAPGERADGESVTVMVPIAGNRQAVTVSKDAIVKAGGLNGVFVVVDGMARFRVVELGVAVGGRVIVLQGLQDGDLAIVRGNEDLDPTVPTPVSPTGAS